MAGSQQGIDLTLRSNRQLIQRGVILIDMSEPATATPEPPKSRMRHFADILNPLFWHDDFNQVDRLFEWACTIVRVSGLKDKGWDSHTESLALLEDLTNLMHLDLPGDKFQHADHTQARLALISYCHVVEMDFPYELLANLLAYASI
jgi:hypothetical protein